VPDSHTHSLGECLPSTRWNPIQTLLFWQHSIYRTREHVSSSQDTNSTKSLRSCMPLDCRAIRTNSFDSTYQLIVDNSMEKLWSCLYCAADHFYDYTEISMETSLFHQYPSSDNIRIIPSFWRHANSTANVLLCYSYGKPRSCLRFIAGPIRLRIPLQLRTYTTIRFDRIACYSRDYGSCLPLEGMPIRFRMVP